MPADVLCILVKEPRPGEVKTRLAPALGPEGAALLARAFLADTLRLALGLRWARVAVAVAGDPERLEVPDAVEVWDQGAGDLGERMERTLRRALSGGGRAILLGTDSPGLPGAFLDAARAGLATHGAVLGPAEDGGFYLIGLHRCDPGLLSGLPWSQPDTMTRTEARLLASGRSVARTGPWFDVDEPRDLERLSGLLARGEVMAPAAGRALASLGLLAGELA